MARRQARFSDGNAQLIAIITGWTADEWASGSPPQGGLRPVHADHPRSTGGRWWGVQSAAAKAAQPRKAALADALMATL
jgi:hypothetical protein